MTRAVPTPQSSATAGAAGPRIRARRAVLGLSQAELARRAGISSAYLNLIEHDRRRIGGKLLNRLAELLDMPAAELTTARPGRLAARLAAAWARHSPNHLPEQSAEEFSLRLPNWAVFCAEALERADQATARAERLAVRAQNDPALRGLLHELLTAASAVRSASAILYGSEELSPEWQARFRRNLDEDSRRLAEGAANLAAWLETNNQDGLSLPEEEADHLLASHGYQFSAFAGGTEDAEAAIEGMLSEASFSSPAAEKLAKSWLRQLAHDARRLPEAMLDEALLADRPDDGAFSQLVLSQLPKTATALDLPLALLLRRLAFSAVARRQGWALMVVDQAGGLKLARPAEGFAPLWAGAACPLLPVFEALRRPYEAIHATLALPSPAGEFRFQAVAAAELIEDEQGRRAEASMLLAPLGDETGEARPVGPGCAHCPREDCTARRSPAFPTG